MPVFMTFIDAPREAAQANGPRMIYMLANAGRGSMPRKSEERVVEDGEDAVRRRIREAGERAWAEATARRADAAADKQPREIGGRGGADPTRYGDWEVKGRASDF
jgi:hypothetical protein